MLSDTTLAIVITNHSALSNPVRKLRNVTERTMTPTLCVGILHLISGLSNGANGVNKFIIPKGIT